MSQVTIEWTQRVAGRMPGTVETVEETAFITACISQRRCDLVVDAPAPAPILGVFEDPASALKAAEEKAEADAAKAVALAAAQKADEDAKAALVAADAALALATSAATDTAPEAPSA